MAKRDRMDGAKRSQSDLDRSSLRAERPCLIGTALYNAPATHGGLARSQSDSAWTERSGVKAVRRDAEQVAATTAGRRSLCGTRGWLG